MVGAGAVVSGALSSPPLQATARAAITHTTPTIRSVGRLMGCTVEEREPSGRASAAYDLMIDAPEENLLIEVTSDIDGTCLAVLALAVDVA